MKTFILICLFAQSANPLWASFIRMQTTADPVEIVNGKGVLSITVINRGDEEAYSVMVEPRFPEGFAVAPSKVMSLSVNQPFVQKLQITTSAALKGTYPAAVVVRYADAN